MAAGSNIRQLALKRRLTAIQYWVGAAFFVVLPFLGNHLLQTFALAVKVKLLTSVWVYPLFWVLAVFLVFAGVHLWKRAGHADQGAAGEADVAASLKPLQAAGWTVQCGIQDRRVGDIDLFLVSPRGRAFTIDVKSHGGQVRYRHGKLYRQYGKQTYAFEKDFLQQAQTQAAVMRDRKGTDVIPVIVFSKATVSLDSPVQGVHVWSKGKLINHLQQLDSGS